MRERWNGRRLETALVVAMLLATPASGAPAARLAGDAAAPAERWIELERRLLTADYRGDLEGLATLREEAAAHHDDPEWGYLARYWSGFASWRSALNGTNVGMAAAELRGHLERAAADFEASIAARPDFADAHAASAGVHGWLAGFHLDEPKLHAKDTLLYFLRVRHALDLEPDNPRALWVDASIDLFLPQGLGADVARAIRTYRRILELTEEPSPPSPLPDWGRPEAFMSLAYAHAHSSLVDLDAALAAARAALRLRPDWAYVSDVLLAQIEAARSARRAPG